MIDYEELIRDWSNEQGFTVWACDHAAVLRNLAKWLSTRGNGWVSVKERLPEGDTVVLVTDGDDIELGCRWRNWDDRKEEWLPYRFEGDIIPNGKVTDWQPLPEPPKGEK